MILTNEFPQQLVIDVHVALLCMNVETDRFDPGGLAAARLRVAAPRAIRATGLSAVVLPRARRALDGFDHAVAHCHTEGHSGNVAQDVMLWIASREPHAAAVQHREQQLSLAMARYVAVQPPDADGGDTEASSPPLLSVSGAAVDLSEERFRGVEGAIRTVVMRDPVAASHEGGDQLAMCLLQVRALPCTTLDMRLCRSLEVLPGDAFCGHAELRTVALPPCLRQIEDYVFYECKFLREVATPPGVPATLESIGDAVWASCPRLQQLDLSACTSLTEIGSFFAQESGIRDVFLPPSLTTIGEAFCADCRFIRTIDLTRCESLTALPSGFAQGSGIETAAMPRSLQCTEDFAFSNCHNLVSLDFSKCTSLTSIGDGFASESTLKSLALPPSITEIGVDVCFNCSKLDAVDVSACTGLTEIPRGFLRQSGVKAVAFPAGITIARDFALQHCEHLSSLDLSHCAGLTDLGVQVAYGALSLVTIALPASIQRIGRACVAECPALREVDLTHCGALTAIDDRFAANATALTSVRFPGSLRTVGAGALSGCSMLASLALSGCARLTELPEDFANGAVALTQVALPPKLESVGVHAFKGSVVGQRCVRGWRAQRARSAGS